jgi:hypothetical protein
VNIDARQKSKQPPVCMDLSWTMLVIKEKKLLDYTGGKMRNLYYEICNCTTKSIVYPYYFDNISIAWKYTIIMDNQNPFYFQ